jgi:hypothetical protein
MENRFSQMYSTSIARTTVVTLAVCTPLVFTTIIQEKEEYLFKIKVSGITRTSLNQKKPPRPPRPQIPGGSS